MFRKKQTLQDILYQVNNINKNLTEIKELLKGNYKKNIETFFTDDESRRNFEDNIKKYINRHD